MGLVVVLVGGAAFSVTILPFIAANRATTTVEVAGSLPTTGMLGQETSFDVAADNTGDGDVQPICVKLTAQPPVSHLSAVFQGLDYVHAAGDLLCGGELAGSETVSIHLAFTPTGAGTTSLRMVAAQGKHEIGPARTWLLFAVARGR
jgi:hypothetical protein